MRIMARAGVSVISALLMLWLSQTWMPQLVLAACQSSLTTRCDSCWFGGNFAPCFGTSSSTKGQKQVPGNSVVQGGSPPTPNIFCEYGGTESCNDCGVGCSINVLQAIQTYCAADQTTATYEVHLCCGSWD